MRRGNRSASLPKETLLKVDKDCLVGMELHREYIRAIIETCRRRGIKAMWIKSTQTRHGIHFYIKIDPPVDAHTANNLQYLLGDDARRVDYNRARINSRLMGWNKLFEAVGRRRKTIYSDAATKAEESTRGRPAAK